MFCWISHISIQLCVVCLKPCVDEPNSLINILDCQNCDDWTENFGFHQFRLWLHKCDCRRDEFLGNVNNSPVDNFDGAILQQAAASLN